MQTIIRPIAPQPVLANPKPPGRWIWGREEPITDQCKGGNSIVSWWNYPDVANDGSLMAQYCPIERPEKAKVMIVFDGDRWLWQVTFTEAQAKAWAKVQAAK
jgi:hypothetical protein